MANALAILNYHGIESRPGGYAWSDAEKPYVIDREAYEWQLDELSRLGYLTLNLAGLDQWNRSPEGRCVLLSFDDGHLSHFEQAAPSLQRRSMRAVFFVSAGLIETEGFMSWNQLRVLRAQGFDIGCHGMTHVPLTGLDAAGLERELKKSKQNLESFLESPVESFSVPRGFMNEKVRRAILDAGYKFIFTSGFGLNRAGAGLGNLRRLPVTARTSRTEFTKMVRGALGARKYAEALKTRARGAVPAQMYDAMAAIKRTMRTAKPQPKQTKRTRGKNHGEG